MNPDELLIADFLADDLPVSQRNEVLQRIEQDQVFADAVRKQQVELVILTAAKRAELKANLKKEIASRTPVRNIRPIWVGLAIAAAITAIVLIFNPFNKEASAQQLAINYLEPFPVQQIRGETAKSRPAIQLYQTGQYPDAVQAFSNLELIKPDHALMYASALMQMKEYKRAIEVLEGIANPGAFADIYTWDLALAYVLNHQYLQARPLLKEIAGSSHFKREEAQELLASAPLSQL